MLHAFSRAEMLLTKEGLEKLKKSTILVCGIGGVGTFAVEGLARCGVGTLILVDNDDVCLTNINRQIHATHNTIGQPKVELMKQRVLEINPDANVITHYGLYNAETADSILTDNLDYVVDAIDMVSAKIDLIERCIKREIKIISSMGTGNKLDPTKLEIIDLSKTKNCPLAKVMRKELRKRGIKKLPVVFSAEEPIKPQNTDDEYETKATGSTVPGSISFVPSVAGMILASRVIRELTGNL